MWKAAWAAVVVCGMVSVAGADIVEFQVAADGDGVITCIATWDSITGTQTIDGVHHLFEAGHILSMEDLFTTDSEIDPTVILVNAMENDTGITWTGYNIKVGIRAKDPNKPLSGLSLLASAVLPADWTATITQPLTYTLSYVDADGRTLEKYYIAEIDYTAGTLVPNGGSVDLRYTLSFSGATSYLFWQETTPIPEPATLALLGVGGLGLVLGRKRR